ncbi:hypothetical protein CPB84DRAFT_1487026 [Gymnopilus junonius]|uniref:Uncharacterized protein n=1 Tax=Gymnopilus junonius TaxID=109634 RepID=A0A9P5NFI4_GYMJU|nr:hypothetical protein CPB84DRAFT_1487026 [Gymnopilus junonius]
MLRTRTKPTSALVVHWSFSGWRHNITTASIPPWMAMLEKCYILLKSIIQSPHTIRSALYVYGENALLGEPAAARVIQAGVYWLVVTLVSAAMYWAKAFCFDCRQIVCRLHFSSFRLHLDLGSRFHFHSTLCEKWLGLRTYHELRIGADVGISINTSNIIRTSTSTSSDQLSTHCSPHLAPPSREGSGDYHVPARPHPHPHLANQTLQACLVCHMAPTPLL